MLRWEIINWLIRRFGYESYLEIGVWKPERCFNRIKCAEKTGVDPAPRGECSHIVTSDEFFAVNKAMFDIIFIDGLHLDYQVVKDVENSLEVLCPGGTIVMHDCNPPTEWHQREHRGSGKWNGTVWRGYMRFRARPDLKMCVIDEDCGVGIIRRGEQDALDIKDLAYEGLSRNRKKWLNLMSFDEFKANLNKQEVS